MADKPFFGLFSFGGNKTAQPTKMVGSSGTSISGGYVQVIDNNPRLSHGQRQLTTADIMANCSIVAAGLRYFLNLVANPAWQVEPAKDINGEESSDEAKAAAEFLESTLYDMNISWVRIIRRSGLFRFHGFGIQEWQAKRREDGLIGYRTIAVRPVHTISRWDTDENGEVLGVTQTNPDNAQEIYLPRSKIIYLVDDSLSDSPEGFGLFRQVVEPAERLKEYLRIEQQGFERDFRGIPVGRAPLSAIDEAIASGELKQEDKPRLLSGIKNFITMRAKGQSTGLLLDSSTYENQSDTGTSATSVPQWGMELLSGGSAGIEHVGTSVRRTNEEIARILGVESMLVGDGGGGSRALSEDKSRNLYLTVNSCVMDIAEAFEHDYVGPLWRLNGLDKKLMPTLKPEDVSFKSVSEITAALRDMATAGAVLAPDDPAIQDVRDLLGISRAPENVEMPDPGF